MLQKRSVRANRQGHGFARNLHQISTGARIEEGLLARVQMLLGVDGNGAIREKSERGQPALAVRRLDRRPCHHRHAELNGQAAQRIEPCVVRGQRDGSSDGRFVARQ